MKRLLPLTVAAVTLWMLAGCGSRPKQDTRGTLAFETFLIDTVCPLIEASDGPRCHFRLSMECPAATVDESLRRVVDEFVVGLYFQDDYAGSSAREAACRYRDAYLDAYLKEGSGVSELYGGDIQAATTWMSYEEVSSGRVVYNDGTLLSYSVRYESYRGGAHGNTIVSNRVLDLATGCIVALGDIFDESDMERVAVLLRERLASNYGCATIDELAEMQPFFSPREIDLTDNFYIDDQGITWQYSPYEIAPYALGVVTVTLPWVSVAPYVEEGSPVAALASQCS